MTSHGAKLSAVLPVMAACLISAHGFCADGGPSIIDVTSLQLSLRYGVFDNAAVVVSGQPVQVRCGGKGMTLQPGTWRFVLAKASPAKSRWHVFPKTFPVDQSAEVSAYVKEWKQKGYQPEVLTFGRSFALPGGGNLDNRMRWVSLARLDTEAQADALKKKLSREEVWAWSRVEMTAEGAGEILISSASGGKAWRGTAPLTLAFEGAVTLDGNGGGADKKALAGKTFAGPLTLRVGLGGKLEVLGRLPLETYLRGVLPAEMPAKWPLEALKAQAVAARSEILAALGGKNHLEGFDFTITELDRAYGGIGCHEPGPDQAVRDTAGLVLKTGDLKIATTVFSACCGGWSENNEVVWAGPANANLRSRPDFSPSTAPKIIPQSAADLKKFLSSAPPAFCDSHKDFRWRKKFTSSELSILVNKCYTVGEVKSVTETERGPGGRLKVVTIQGAKGTVRVERELAIRQTFGGLPSALFVIIPENVNNKTKSYTFIGGGRGHGVGLCQQGARSMAEKGLGFRDILKQYFSGVDIERVTP